METRFSRGSISQPRRAPLSRYSCIFSCRSFRRSVGERNSTTKSGQINPKPSRSLLGSASQRSRFSQDASGERFAPLGRVKSVEESKAIPVPSSSVHASKRRVSLLFRRPESKLVGGHNDQLSPSCEFKLKVWVLLTQAHELLFGQLSFVNVELEGQ